MQEDITNTLTVDFGIGGGCLVVVLKNGELKHVDFSPPNANDVETEMLRFILQHWSKFNELVERIEEITGVKRRG